MLPGYAGDGTGEGASYGGYALPATGFPFDGVLAAGSHVV
jgi:hypothetical protein